MRLIDLIVNSLKPKWFCVPGLTIKLKSMSKYGQGVIVLLSGKTLHWRQHLQLLV